MSTIGLGWPIITVPIFVAILVLVLILVGFFEFFPVCHHFSPSLPTPDGVGIGSTGAKFSDWGSLGWKARNWRVLKYGSSCKPPGQRP
jgi:hypothetical protein